MVTSDEVPKDNYKEARMEMKNIEEVQMWMSYTIQELIEVINTNNQ